MVRREETLTVRDSEVVGLLSQGLKDKEIAEELGIAHGSVRNRLLGIYRKLQVRTRTEAVVAYLNLKEYPIETS